MKKTIMYFTVWLMSITAFAQAPPSINYQAVARDNTGQILADTPLEAIITIRSKEANGTAVYTETFNQTTNAFGLLNLKIGALQTTEFSEIDWSDGPFFIELKINDVLMGVSQILSVPYALHAQTAEQTINNPWQTVDGQVVTQNPVSIGHAQSDALFSVGADESHDDDTPIFEIKNAQGEVVFAVYNNRVEAIFDEHDEKSRGGFAVSGRTTGKDTAQEVFSVSSQGTHVIVGEEVNDKSRGGFAVSGRTTGKSEYETLLNISPQRTEFFVHTEPSDKSRGGFAVSGRTTGKEEAMEIFTISDFGTQIFVEENHQDKSRGGFAVSGRTTGKDNVRDIFRVNLGLTEIIVDELSDKSRGGFVVSGRTAGKSSFSDILNISPEITEFFVNEDMMNKSRGGFAVSGRTTGKNESQYQLFSIKPERTDFYLKPSPDKALPQGFSISAFNYLMEPMELFVVSETGTFVNASLSVPPKVQSLDITDITQTAAVFHGEVESYDGSPIEKRGFIYSQSPNPAYSPSLENLENPSLAGVVWDEGFTEDFEVYQLNALTLAPGTQYFVRAFAVNEDGLIGYGTINSFSTEAPYNLGIQLFDNETEQTVDNAVITITPSTHPHLPAITNPAGDYDFALAAGQYDIHITAPNYMEFNNVIVVTQEGDQFIFGLEAIPADAAPVIFDAKDGQEQALQGVQIFITHDGEGGHLSGSTNEEGVLAFLLLPGEYYYYADYTYDDGFFQGLDDGFIVSEEDEEIIIDLVFVEPERYTVEFLVQDQNQNPLEAAIVNLSMHHKSQNPNKADKEVFFEGETNAEGVLVFSNVPEGEYTYYAALGEAFVANGFFLMEDIQVTVTLVIEK